MAEANLQYGLEYLESMGPLLDLKSLVVWVRNTIFTKRDRRSNKPTEYLLGMLPVRQ